MYVIDVIPLSRTAPGILSYRSKANLAVGTIVSIPVRKTLTQGIVIGSMPVTDAKEMLKHARFLLSRSVPTASGMLPEAVMRATERTALYHATTPGAVLAAMFGEHIRLGMPLSAQALADGAGFERSFCEKPLPERVRDFETRIRAMTDDGHATLLVVPTIPELSYWSAMLRKHHPLVISGTLTGPKRAQAIEKAASHVGLIITTPSFSWVPIERLGLAMLDRVSAGTYTLPKRPYLSVPYALEALMRERGTPFVVGDFPLPLEYRPDGTAPGNASDAERTSVSIIDARTPKDAPDESRAWQALPEKVVGTIRDELAAGGRAVIIAARKGYAPAVVCRDCGQAQTDERGMPLSFSMANGQRIFQTSDGATILDAKRMCQRCGSWNLLPLGIGAERVEEELKKELPNANLLLATPEILASPRKARALVRESRAAGSVLIGTEALLPWLYEADAPESKPLGVVASADSLLSLPFWRARERFVRLVQFLGSASDRVILVTRRPDDTAMEAAADPRTPAFWAEERALREALGYPPYGTLITLAIEGTEKRAAHEAESLKESLESRSPALLPPRHVRGTVWRSVVALRLPEGVWPEKTLSDRLRSLPPTVRARIDPESLW